MKKDFYIHIGTHKTGTTSIQTFLLKNISSFPDYGLYNGLYKPDNHIELHVASMRQGRDSFFKSLNRIDVNLKYKESIRNRIRSFIENSSENKIIFTAEGLSYLRFDDEIEYLKSLLSPYANSFKIILYIRDKTDFLKSYARTLELSNIEFSNDPMSFAFVKNSSWLVDYDSLYNAYSRVFTSHAVKINNYDDLLSQEGNIIPSFLRNLNIEAQIDLSLDVWENITPTL